MKFKALNLHPSLHEGIDAMGYEETTPVQEQTIPAILDKKDIIACAQTGTGKTAAFLIPVIHNLLTHRSGKIGAIIIVPTRELAIQIDQHLQGIAYFSGVSSKAIYGGGDGQGFDVEKKALTTGVDIVVATPGKFLQHLNMGYIDTSGVLHFILDEADRMLDMGFSDDIMRIESKLPKEKQTLMFSATMPGFIRKLAHRLLHDPIEINLGLAKPAEGVIQAAYLVNDKDKNLLIASLLKGKDLNSIIIFAATKIAVKQLEQHLQRLEGFTTKAMHSDLDQPTREATLNQFKNRGFEILVATDIMSRGIDIEKIDLIINYNVPQDAEDYVHRVGRTARAKSTGVAITLINHKEISNFYRIEKLIDTEVRKLPLPPGIPPGPEYKPRQSSNRDYQKNTKPDYGRKKNKNSHKKKFQNRNDSNTSVNKGIHK